MGVETEAEYGGSDMSFMSAILVIEGTCAAADAIRIYRYPTYIH